MKRLIVLLVSAFFICVGTGCPTAPTTPATTSDPVLLAAENGYAAGLGTINGFLQLEYANRTIIQQQAPEVDTFAIQLGRTDAPAALSAAQKAITAYQSAQTTGNASTMQADIDALSSLANSIAPYLTKAQATTQPSKAS